VLPILTHWLFLPSCSVALPWIPRPDRKLLVLTVAVAPGKADIGPKVSAGSWKQATTTYSATGVINRSALV
jgi:hypothetical protein